MNTPLPISDPHGDIRSLDYGLLSTSLTDALIDRQLSSMTDCSIGKIVVAA